MPRAPVAVVRPAPAVSGRRGAGRGWRFPPGRRRAIRRKAPRSRGKRRCGRGCGRRVPNTATPAVRWSSVRALDSRRLLQFARAPPPTSETSSAPPTVPSSIGMSSTCGAPPVAGDDSRGAVVEETAAARSPRGSPRACAIGNSSMPEVSTASGLRSLHGSHIGGVDPGQPADPVAPPEREWQQVGERAERRHLVDDVRPPAPSARRRSGARRSAREDAARGATAAGACRSPRASAPACRADVRSETPRP